MIELSRNACRWDRVVRGAHLRANRFSTDDWMRTDTPTSPENSQPPASWKETIR